MSEFIHGFTESMAQQSNFTSDYGSNLVANGTRTAAVTLDMNGSWRGPGYMGAASVGDGFQAGIRPTHDRVEKRAIGISHITGQYDNQIGSEQSVMNAVGLFSLTA